MISYRLKPRVPNCNAYTVHLQSVRIIIIIFSVPTQDTNNITHDPPSLIVVYLCYSTFFYRIVVEYYFLVER